MMMTARELEAELNDLARCESCGKFVPEDELIEFLTVLCCDTCYSGE